MLGHRINNCTQVHARERNLSKQALRKIFSRAGLRQDLDLPPIKTATVQTVSWAQIINVLEQVDGRKAFLLGFALRQNKISLKTKIAIRDKELTVENVQDILKREEFDSLTADTCAEGEALLKEADELLAASPSTTVRWVPLPPPIPRAQTHFLMSLMREALEQRALLAQDQQIVEQIYWAYVIFPYEAILLNREETLTLAQQERFANSPADLGKFFAAAFHRVYPQREVSKVGAALHCLNTQLSPGQIAEAAFAAAQILGPASLAIACEGLGTCIFPLHESETNKERLAQYQEAIKGMS